jgi:hypothetical protein
LATGTVEVEKAIAAIRDFIAAILDVNLRGEPGFALLSGTSSKYPDGVVTTQMAVAVRCALDDVPIQD